VVIVGGGAPFAESDMAASRVKDCLVGRVRDQSRVYGRTRLSEE
jgi:hypothetical protein